MTFDEALIGEEYTITVTGEVDAATSTIGELQLTFMVVEPSCATCSLSIEILASDMPPDATYVIGDHERSEIIEPFDVLSHHCLPEDIVYGAIIHKDGVEVEYLSTPFSFETATNTLSWQTDNSNDAGVYDVYIRGFIVNDRSTDNPEVRGKFTVTIEYVS